jgi:hypothetical protein
MSAFEEDTPEIKQLKAKIASLSRENGALREAVRTILEHTPKIRFF